MTICRTWNSSTPRRDTCSRLTERRGGGWGGPVRPREELEAPAEPSFIRYSGTSARALLREVYQAGPHLSYYGGEHLDRFSRYQPSFFSRPRIRGIPSGTDTFDALAVAGVSRFNIMDFVKLEGSYNHAWGRNRTESPTFHAYDGQDFDFKTAAPWGTYIQGMFTYALRATRPATTAVRHLPPDLETAALGAHGARQGRSLW